VLAVIDSHMLLGFLLNAGFINGSEFINHCSPVPAAAVPPSSSASSTPPTAKADLPSVKKRPKRSKSGVKGDASADGGMFLLRVCGTVC